jgi:hypothetical protein
MVRLLIGSAVALFSVSPVIAGPCTQKIADLEKSISAKQEGAGPALAAPATTSSTTSGSSSTQKVEQPSGTGTVQTQGLSEAMNMLKQAKEFDQQGKEAECMQITTRVSSMAPPATK